MATSPWGSNLPASTPGPNPLTDCCCCPQYAPTSTCAHYICLYTYLCLGTTTVLFRKGTFQRLLLLRAAAQEATDCRSPAGAGAVARAEPTPGARRGSLRHEPRGAEGIPLARTPGRGGDPSGTNPGARRGSLRHESWLAAAPSAGERERLRLLSLLVEPRGSVWDPGSFCPRQRCGAAPQGWGAADVFLDLLNESITFFLLFSHPHQQLLPAEGGRVICLFVGRRKTENRAVP